MALKSGDVAGINPLYSYLGGYLNLENSRQTSAIMFMVTCEMLDVRGKRVSLHYRADARTAQFLATECSGVDVWAEQSGEFWEKFLEKQSGQQVDYMWLNNMTVTSTIVGVMVGVEQVWLRSGAVVDWDMLTEVVREKRNSGMLRLRKIKPFHKNRPPNHVVVALKQIEMG